jgi:hypothetical protein
MERYYIYIPQKVNDKLKPARAADMFCARGIIMPLLVVLCLRADYRTLIGTSAQGFAPSCGSRLSFGG